MIGYVLLSLFCCKRIDLTKLILATSRLKADMLANHEESVKNFVSNDQSFLFCEVTQGDSCVLKKISRRSFSKGKTIRVSNIFLKLSWVNLRWNEFLEYLQNLTALVLVLKMLNAWTILKSAIF